MLIRLEDRRTRYALFVLLALTINLIDGLLVRSLGNSPRRTIVAACATLDLVVVVSAIYYWLLVRPGIQGRASLLAIALAGALHATYLYPNETVVRAIVASLCELGLITFVVVQVRRKTEGQTDVVDALQSALSGVFVIPVVARIVALEVSVLYYALFSWCAKPHVPPDAQAFSVHKQSGRADLLGALALACVFEIVPVHLLLKHWSPWAAWVASALSLYAVIWLMGMARSIVLRPVLVGPDYLDLRYGISFRLRVPRDMIACVRRAEMSDRTSATLAPRRTEPNTWIELVSEMAAYGLFGARKRVTQIALSIDDDSAFQRAVVRQ